MWFVNVVVDRQTVATVSPPQHQLVTDTSASQEGMYVYVCVFLNAHFFVCLCMCVEMCVLVCLVVGV